MKIRVVPFDSSNHYYCIEYKLSKKHLFHFPQWQTFEEAYITDEEWLCDTDQPVLFENHDEAVQYAKLLDEQKIIDHNQREQAKYDAHVAEIRKRVASRDKTTYL